MKQMDECLDRFFEGKDPLMSKKWKATGHEDFPNCLLLFHYQHLVLVYNLQTHVHEYEWYEVPTDLRGLNAAKAYLKAKFNT